MHSEILPKVLDLYEDTIWSPLGCLPNAQFVDLTRRRELKPEVCLKIAPSVRVECAGQIQPIVLDAASSKSSVCAIIPAFRCGAAIMRWKWDGNSGATG